MTTKCTKDDPRIPWLCNCDECCRRAAHQWTALMERVFDGTLDLAEAVAIDEAKR